MPAHFAAHEGACFFHLLLDEGVTRLPHDGLTAMLLDIIKKVS